MTKAELIDRIARSRDLPPDVTKKIIAKVLDLAFAELGAYFVRSRITRTNNPRFTFPKFGTFTKKRRSGRRGVNPRTLEPMEIEACETVDFKPSIELKQKLNEAAGPAKPSPKSRSKTSRKKKAARSSTKAKTKTKSKAKSKTKNKTGRSKSVAAEGPGGRKLVTREEAELELPMGEPLLPEAPLQKARRRRRTDLDGTGS